MTTQVRLSTAIRTLVWEQWRQMCTILFLVLGIGYLTTTVILLQILVRYNTMKLKGVTFQDFLDNHVLNSKLQSLSANILWILVVIGGICFICSPNENGELQFGFSRRLFRLPLKSRILGNSILFFRTFLYGSMITLLFLSQFYLYSFNQIASFAAIGMLFYMLAQAAAWRFGGFHGGLAMGWIVGLSLFILLAYAWLTQDAHVAKNCAVWGLAFTTIPFSIAWGVMGIAMDRRGAFMNVPGLRDLLDWLQGFLHHKQRPFASPLEAQKWLIRRRKGFLYPMILLIFVLAILTWAVASRGLSMYYYLYVFPYIFPVVMLIAAFPAGLFEGLMEYRSATGSMVRFVAVRPIRTTTWAYAEYWMGVRNIGIMFGVLLLLYLSCWMEPLLSVEREMGLKVLPTFLYGISPQTWLLFLVRMVYVVGIIWALLWCGHFITIALIDALCIPLAIGLWIEMIPWAYQHVGHLSAIHTVYNGTATFLIIAWAFRRAIQEKLITLRGTCGWVAVWLGVCLGQGWVVAVITARAYHKELFDFSSTPMHLDEVYQMAAFTALMILPFAAIPLRIHWMRHR